MPLAIVRPRPPPSCCLDLVASPTTRAVVCNCYARAFDLGAGVADTQESPVVLHWTDDEIFADGFGTGGLERWSDSAP